MNTKENHTINQFKIDHKSLHDPVAVAQALNQHFSSGCSTLLPVSCTNALCCITLPTVRSSFSFSKIMPTEVLSSAGLIDQIDTLN